MADNQNGSSSVFKSPVLLGLFVLLLVLIGAFAGNQFLMTSGAGSLGEQIDAAHRIKALSQAIAKHAASASDGNGAAFGALAEDKSAFDAELNALRGDAPDSAASTIGQISGLWSDMSAQIDVVVANRAAVTELKDATTDLAITMSAIQQENNKIVAAMLRLGAASNEIALVQRQAFLIERMSHSINKALERDGNSTLPDTFNRDSQNFKRVLDGLTNGDRDLLLTAATDADVRNSLVRIAEFYPSIAGASADLIEKASKVNAARNAAGAIYVNSAEFILLGDQLVNSIRNGGGGIASPMISIVIGAVIFVVFLVIVVVVYQASNSSVSETTQQNEENQAAILQLLDELADLADGDLRVQATVTESFTGAIADSINFTIDQMRGLVSQINDTSGKVSSATDNTKSSVSELAEASQRQASEIADVSEAVNEMAVSIDMVSYNAAESSSVAERSVDIASKGAVVVQNTIDGMDNIRGQIQETAKRIKRLGESSQEIGDIVALINDIADQTNILSLNAAIQASMAGDAGKGFAVVADEVQRLAERSGAAAKQISALVKTIQSDTNEAVSSMEQTTAEVVQGTRLAQDAGVALGEIEGVSKSLAEIIENISDAARQQAASAGKISNTMKSIQEITTATTDGTKATATAVGNLADMTDELRSSVSGFKLPE